MLDLHEREVQSDESLRAFLDDEACYLMLALAADGLVVGSLSGYRFLNPHGMRPQCLLYEIDVLAKERNGGSGKRLIGVFADSPRRVDACEIWVVRNRSNHPAVAMYSAMGFVPVNDDDQMLELRFVP
jgi:hypothetical protein